MIVKKSKRISSDHSCVLWSTCSVLESGFLHLSHARHSHSCSFFAEDQSISTSVTHGSSVTLLLHQQHFRIPWPFLPLPCSPIPFVAEGIPLLPFHALWQPRPSSGNRLLYLLNASTRDLFARFTSIKHIGKTFPTLLGCYHKSAKLAVITSIMLEHIQDRSACKKPLHVFLSLDCLAPSHSKLQLQHIPLIWHFFGITHTQSVSSPLPHTGLSDVLLLLYLKIKRSDSPPRLMGVAHCSQ